MIGRSWRFWGLGAAISAMSILTGCASVTHGTTQSVKIETMAPGGKVIDGAECRIANDKSDAVMLSGQSVPVRRSGANLSIECTQPGYAPAGGVATSRVNPGMVGNILIGGLIGVVIDAGTGSGFNYPSWMQLVFGEVRSFDRSSQNGDQPTAGLKVGETRLASTPPAAASTAPKVATEPPKPVAGPIQPAVAPPLPVPAPAPTVTSAPAAPAPTAVPAAATATRVSMDDLKALLPARP